MNETYICILLGSTHDAVACRCGLGKDT